MEFPPIPPATEGVEEGEPPHFPSPDDIRENLRRQPKPMVATTYNLAEAEFWRHWHVPAGSVVVFPGGYIEESSTAECAVVVKEKEATENGIWLTVKCLGCSVKEFQKTFIDHFKRGKTKIHLCYGEATKCPFILDECLHLDRFTWHPPGEFAEKWLSAASKKAVAEGVKAALAELEAESRQAPPAGPDTRLEERLQKLKERSGRKVTFAGDGTARPPALRGDGTRATCPGGTGPVVANSTPAPLKLKDLSQVKTEDMDLISVSEESQEKSKKKKKKKRIKTVEDRLEKAVAERRKREEKRDSKEKKRKSRSRSRGRSRRKRKRRKSDSSTRSSRSRSRSDSKSSDSLVPPLKKRAKKSPGSVFKMLEDQAVEQLAQDGVLEEEYMDGSGDGKRPKIFTYFQLALKPGLDTKSRDCREISLLSRCLDLLREGRLAHLADTLAARLLAVETATRQGWATAKHLEIYGPDEEGPVPAHILLSAQKHQRQVEKAGGKGSWSRGYGGGWSSWQTEASPKGKGKDVKGKGKKGKGKGKGKGVMENKHEAEAKPKAGDA